MKAVTIIGCAEGWQNAPSDVESWGITNIVLRRKVDRNFDIHDLTWTVQQWYDHYMLWIPGHYGQNAMLAKAQNRVKQVPSVFKRIKELDIPFYTTRAYEELPSSRPYPIERMKEQFHTDYFASTFDYAIALAISEDFGQIDLYGVKMSIADEYEHQLKSAQYWLGLARGMGIEVEVHGESALFKTKCGKMYGYNK